MYKGGLYMTNTLDTRIYYTAKEICPIIVGDDVFDESDVKKLTRYGIIKHSYVYQNGEYGYTIEDRTEYVWGMNNFFKSKKSILKYLKKHNIKNAEDIVKDLIKFFQEPVFIIKYDVDMYIVGKKRYQPKKTLNEHIFDFIFIILKCISYMFMILVLIMALLFFGYLFYLFVPFWVLLIVAFIFTIGQIKI